MLLLFRAVRDGRNFVIADASDFHSSNGEIRNRMDVDTASGR